MVQELGTEAEMETNCEQHRRSHEQARREARESLLPHELPQGVRGAYSASARVMVRPVQGRPPGPVPKLLDLAKLRPMRDLVQCPHHGKRIRGVPPELA